MSAPGWTPLCLMFKHFFTIPTIFGLSDRTQAEKKKHSNSKTRFYFYSALVLPNVWRCSLNEIRWQTLKGTLSQTRGMRCGYRSTRMCAAASQKWNLSPRVTSAERPAQWCHSQPCTDHCLHRKARHMECELISFTDKVFYIWKDPNWPRKYVRHFPQINLQDMVYVRLKVWRP